MSTRMNSSEEYDTAYLITITVLSLVALPHTGNFIVLADRSN